MRQPTSEPGPHNSVAAALVVYGFGGSCFTYIGGLGHMYSVDKPYDPLYDPRKPLCLPNAKGTSPTIQSPQRPELKWKLPSGLRSTGLRRLSSYGGVPKIKFRLQNYGESRGQMYHELETNHIKKGVGFPQIGGTL